MHKIIKVWELFYIINYNKHINQFLSLNYLNINFYLVVFSKKKKKTIIFFILLIRRLKLVSNDQYYFKKYYIKYV